MWPQIGEYIEDGRTIRVFKAAHAAAPAEFYPQANRKMADGSLRTCSFAGMQLVRGAMQLSEISELRF